MKVRFTLEALSAIRVKRDWWEANREKAPQLFREELEAVIAELSEGRFERAQLYTVVASEKIWRLRMPKTKAHVYYRVDSARQVVEIITVWNATSGEGPTF